MLILVITYSFLLEKFLVRLTVPFLQLHLLLEEPPGLFNTNIFLLRTSLFLSLNQFLLEKHNVINFFLDRFKVRGSLILLKIKRRLYNG